MNKILHLTLFLSFGLLSYKTSEKEIDKLEIAKQYYMVLDDSDTSLITTLLNDSIVIRESEYDYQETFSAKGYATWLQWDSVFDPTYKILEIEQEGERVISTISKMDKRILFLHEVPIVSKEVLHFDKNKIIKVEKIEYPVFNDSIFVKNRDEFLSWMDANHPELNDFIYDQTKGGGLKYLRAIDLYKNRK